MADGHAHRSTRYKVGPAVFQPECPAVSIPLSILTPLRHRDGKFAKVCMQNPLFCCIFGSQNVVGCHLLCTIFGRMLHFSLWSPEKRTGDRSIQAYCLKTKIPNIPIYSYNVQWTFGVRFLQRRKTDKKYSSRLFGSRNLAKKNHLQVTPSGHWHAGKRKTQQLLKLAKSYEMWGGTAAKLSLGS